MSYSGNTERKEHTWLKLDVLGGWIENEWLPAFDGQEMLTLHIPDACVDHRALDRFDRDKVLEGGYRYAGREAVRCPLAANITSYDYQGEMRYETGGFRYRFEPTEGGEKQEALVVAAHANDEGGQIVTLACLPRSLYDTWTDFSRECIRLANAREPESEVIVIGGRNGSFEATTRWDDVILPDTLKDDLLDDVRSFFHKGINVYKRLNLKPFRKLLLAGVPGTGKTMLCSALAKWALEQSFLVIYVSSERKWAGDASGASFSKIQRALSIAADSSLPTMIILEELDAYLHREEKALVLNVLDGSESSINDRGTLLVATTNYPEAIDERVLKRPGRLDRVFIVPETRTSADAEQMLRHYLGDMWRDDHRALVRRLVGYPGAFIREVAIYALTQVAYDDLEDLPLDLLERSFKGLKDQIDARDEFIKKRPSMGLVGQTNGHRDEE